MTHNNHTASLPFTTVKDFIERHCMKNRTIVSRDIPSILDDIERVTELPLVRHRYKTGEDHGTWVVPPRWDVKEAWLKDEKGAVIASYKEHPLFVAPYSMSVHTKISKEELLAHTISSAKQPDAFQYNWRYALNAQLRLKDWGISLPKQRIAALSNGPFEICIDADTSEGEMLVGEMILPGERKDTFLFVADYCHPGQANDSFSGLALFMQVMHALAKQPQHRYTYQLLIVPETIGSAVYIASDPRKVKNIFGALFADSVGYGEKWYLKATRTGESYIDLLAADCRRAFPDVDTSPFWSLTGNDEYIFDSVQVGIPALALMKHPFVEYHTSNDTPSLIHESELACAYDIVMHMVSALEQDEVFAHTQPVPFWMSRYDLFADAIYERETHIRNFDIVYRLLDGKRSVLHITNTVDCGFDDIMPYFQKMLANNLVRPSGIPPWV